MIDLIMWIDEASIDIYRRNWKIGSMGVGDGLYMYDVVVKMFTFVISSYLKHIATLYLVKYWCLLTDSIQWSGLLATRY